MRKKGRAKNRESSGKRKAMMLLVLSLLLAVLMGAPLSSIDSGQQKIIYLSVEKQSYSVGEQIVLIIASDNPSDFELVMNAGNDYYRYSGELKSNVAFYPKEEGLHHVELISKSTRQILDSLEFSVGLPMPPAASGAENTTIPGVPAGSNVSESEGSIENTGNTGGTGSTGGAGESSAKIITDKAEYLLGENVFARVEIPAGLSMISLKLYYEYEGFSQRYMGDFADISFRPRGIGTHRLVLKDNGDQVLYSASFKVKEDSSAPQDNRPEESTSEGADEKPKIVPYPEDKGLIGNFRVKDHDGYSERMSVSIIRKTAISPVVDYSLNYQKNLADSIKDEKNGYEVEVTGNETDTESDSESINEAIHNSDYNISSNTTINEYDIEITLSGKAVKKISLNNLRMEGELENQGLSIGVEDVPAGSVSIKDNKDYDENYGKGYSKGNDVLRAFAINPEGIDFTDGKASITAVGRELWKCKEWIYDNQSCAGSWEKIMDLSPGKEYSIALTPDDPGYAETGVATVNTKKSIYHPGENAEFIIVVLDTEGNLVSDANVDLTIIRPDSTVSSLSTAAGGLINSDKGIYIGNYSGTSIEGNYSLIVSAEGEGINSTMSSQFSVMAYYAFDIIREAPAAIDPWKGPVLSKIKVISYVGTTGSVFELVEIVPESFNITDSGGGVVSVVGNKKHISWAGLANGSEVNYSFQAPLVSPELYVLGESIIIYSGSAYNDSSNGSSKDMFVEARQWYLAADPTFVGKFFMLWDGSSSAPSGWTCVSCAPSDPFYGRLIRGSISYGSPSGSASHSHSISYAGETAGLGIERASSGGVASGSRASNTHTHEGIGAATTGAASNYPMYRQLKVISYPNLPEIIPAGAIGLFNTTSLPVGWTQYSQENDYFIVGNTTANVTGGSNNHTHSASITTSSSTGTSTARSGGTQANVGADAHTHAGSGTTALSNNTPDYINVVLAKADANTIIPYSQGFVGMFNDSLGDGWTNLSSAGQPFYERMIRGSSSYGGIGGTNNNTHSNLAITTAVSTTATARSGTGRNFADPAHTHNMTVSFNTSSNIPPYINVVFGYANNTPPMPPAIRDTQCYRQGVGWVGCGNITFNTNFTSVRTNCTSRNEMTINNVTLVFFNHDDSKIFFNVTATDNSSGYWTYDITDILLQDSGWMVLNISCSDGMLSEQAVNWTVAWGTLSTILINPTGNRNVSSNKFFNFTSRVTCSGGECGYVKATLDPEADWWNRSWKNRKQVKINATSFLPTRYTVEMNLSTVGNETLDNASDVRVVYWNGTANIEIDRHIINNNTANSTLFFALQDNITSGILSTDYYIYYNNSNAPSPPSNLSKVFIYGADFETGTDSWTVAGQTYTWERANDLLGASVTGCRGNDCDEPSGALSGSYAWGTNIGGIYPNDADTYGYVQSPAIDLSSYSSQNLSLYYYEAWQLEGAGYDTGRVRIANNAAFTGATTLESFNPATGCDATCAYHDWNQSKADVSAYDASLYIRFEMEADTSWQWTGLYFDFVTVRINASSEPRISLGIQENEIKGIIPMDSGEPFYTTTANPMYFTDNSCLENMIAGNTCNTTWQVNATGEIDTTWSFFSYYESLNYSANVSQSNSSKINITILGFLPPTIGSIQCYRRGTGWTFCSNINFNSNFTDVRAECEAGEGNPITNVTFNFTNLEDNKTFFDVSTSDYISGYWYYNITDIWLQDSGTMNLTVTCSEQDAGTATSNIGWQVAWGTLSAALINPSANSNVTKGEFFNFTSRITCLGGECGYLQAVLDPPVGWWDEGWNRRKQISLGSIAGIDLYNYTYLINISYDDDMQEDYDDLRFINGNCTDGSSILLSHEIDNFTSADALVWVKLPVLNSSGNNICMYYANSSASAPSNQESTWTGYAMVHHMDEPIDADGGTEEFLDSTSNNNDGDSTSITSSENVIGMIGGAVSFPGDPDRIEMDNTESFLFSDDTYSISAWIYPTSLADANMAIMESTDTDNQGFRFRVAGTTQLKMQNSYSFADIGPQGGTLVTNQWQHVAAQVNGTSATVYINGVAVSTAAIDAYTQDNVVISIGDHYSGSGSSIADFLGRIDEVQIHADALPSGWFNQSYNMVVNQNTLVSFGEEEKGTKGIIPMYNGTPFYTIDSNPMYPENNSCLASMTASSSCNTTWQVNATGEDFSTWTFFVSYESLNYSSITTNTTRINITIIPNLAPSVSWVTIIPSRPRFDYDLNCTFMVTDPNPGDLLSANISWYMNGTLMLSNIMSVDSGTEEKDILSYTNLSIGDVWWCGVTPYDSYSSGNQMNSSNVTILASLPPTVSNIECQRNRAVWLSCPSMSFFQNISAVRAKCDDEDGYPVNATFILKNIEDDKTFFTGTSDDNSTGYYVFDNDDFMILDSGIFNLSVMCIDNNNTDGYGNSTWLVPWGTLSASLINPSTPTNVTRNRFFDFTSQVSCSGGECGHINATLDPINWWNSSWNYRRTILAVEMSNNSLTDYQFNVTIDTQTPISEGKMKPDCTDIRLTTNNSKVLDYWIQSGCDSTNTLIWVKNNVSALRNITMYVYYGNPNATNVSNGTRTMFIFEDMTAPPSGSLTGNATYIDSTWGVRLTVAANDLLGYLYYIRNPGKGFYGYYETWAGGGSGNGADATWIGAYDRSASSAREDIVDGGYHFTVDEYGTNGGDGRVAFTNSTADNGVPIAYWTNTNLDDSNWHSLEVYFYNNGTVANTSVYYDGTRRIYTTHSPSQSTSGNYFSFAGRTGGQTNYHYIRSIVMRRYVNPQPIVTLDSEIPQTKGIIPMYSGDPFYTITANPMLPNNNSCLANMIWGNICNTTWEVNATGITGVPWEFFVTYDTLNYSSYVAEKLTSKVNITIVNNIAPSVLSANISPSYPLPSEDLNCSFVIYDSNAMDALSANVTWYRNNVPYLDVTVNASNMVVKVVTLGFGNTSLGESWKCGVTPYDEELYGSQVNSSNVTIVFSKPPVVNQLQCLINNSVWTNCSKLGFGSNLSGVRANCTTAYMPIANVTFNMTNTPDSKLFFHNTTAINDSDWWTVYNNMTINDSGEFIVNALCVNNDSAGELKSDIWIVPWGSIVITLISPNVNGNVESNYFFNFTSQVTCTGGECGDLNVILDPESPESESTSLENRMYERSFAPISTEVNLYDSEPILSESNFKGDQNKISNSNNMDDNYNNDNNHNNKYDNYNENHGNDFKQIKPVISTAMLSKNAGNPKHPRGLITITPLRATYDLWEPAELFVVVLDKKGELVPDADLSLILKRPDMKDDIFSSNDFVELKEGLYSLTYSRLDVPGRYYLSLMSGGRVIDSTSNSFVVKDYYLDDWLSEDSSFDIRRDAPLAINPWDGTEGVSEVRIKVRRNDKNLPSSFSLIETVPYGLEIIASEGADVWTSEERKETYLSWSGLSDNSEVSYSFRPQKISPERYGLQAAVSAEAELFLEARPWYIAADPSSFYSASAGSVSYYTNSGGYTQANGGTYANTLIRDCSGGTCTQSNSWVTGFIDISTADRTCYLNTTMRFNLSDIKSVYLRNISLTWSGCWHGDQNLGNQRCDNITRPEFSAGTGGGTLDMWINHSGSFESLSCVDSVGGECGTADEINLGTTSASPSWGNAHGYNTFRFQKSDIDSTYVNDGIMSLTWRTWGVGVCADSNNDEILFALDYANLTAGWSYIIKNGSMVSTTIGDDPFYTIDANPVSKLNDSCLSSMIAGESCNITWHVNATGGINTTHVFYVISNSSTYPYYVLSNESTHILLTIRDTTKIPPVVTLNNPSVNYATTNHSILFNCSATDNRGLVSMALFANFDGTFQENESMSVGGLSNSTTYARTLNEGIYLWNCQAFDNDDNNAFATVNRTLTIDNTTPEVDLVYPNNNDEFSSTTVNFRFIATDNLASSITCNITIDSVVRDININANNGSTTSRNINNIGQGDHWWNVTCADRAGNTNTSETRNFTIVNTPPTVTLQTINEYTTNAASFELIYLPDDTSNISKADLYINGTWIRNETEVDKGSLNGFTVSGFQEGRYNWTVNVTDDGNLTAQATPRWFIVDFTGPFVNATYPPDNDTINSSSIVINFTAIDNYDLVLNCKITFNGTVVLSGISANNNTNVSRTVTGIKDGLNYWNVSCEDNAGNTNYSETRRITVSAPPVVNLNSPADNHSQNTANIILYYTPSDNTNLSSCTLTINNAPNSTNTTINNGVQNNFRLNNLVSGYYNWSVNCTDTDGNIGSSATRAFSIDIGLPYIILNSPAPNGIVYGTTVFNFTAYDDMAPMLYCNLTLDGKVNRTNILAPNGEWVNISVQITNETVHWWNVSCADPAGNKNTSETRNFSTINAPTITLMAPEPNAALNYSTNINLTYLPSSSNSLTLAKIIINGTIYDTVPNPSPGIANSYFINLSEGVYNWSVNVTDSVGLEGASLTRNFTVDTTAPILTIITPNNTANITTNNVSFSFIVSDNLASSLYCNITLGPDQEWENLTVSNGSTTIRSKILFDGDYNWSVRCADAAGNANPYMMINFTVDAPPNITLNAPKINHRTTDQNITFDYTPIDMIGFKNCSLYLNGTYIMNSTSVTRNVPNYFNMTDLGEGVYNWTIECYDQEPDYNWFIAPERNFTIDLSPPVIIMNYPAPDESVNSNDVQFNWTGIDYAGIMINCSLFVDEEFNRTVSQVSGSYFTPTVYNLSKGNHNWTVNCSDDLGNNITSETRNFSINDPDLFINSSRITFNNTNPNENQTINITANVSNIGGFPATGVTVSFWDGDPNAGGVFIANVTGSVNSGSSTRFSTLWNISAAYHTIYVLVDPADLILEMNESNNNATANISPLTSYISYPPNQSMHNTSSVTINFTVNDYTGGTLNYIIYVDGISAASSSAQDTDPQSIPVSVSDGTRVIRVEAEDSLGRRKNSTAVTIYVDSRAPSVYFISPTPTDNFVQSSQEVTINVSHSDAHPDSIILYWQGAPYQTKSYSGAYTNFTLTGLGDGIYSYYVWLNDTYSLANQTETRTVRIDLQNPVINLESPPNESTISSSVAELAFNVTDSSQYINCSLYIDDVFNKSRSSIPTNTAGQRFVQQFSDGTYSWYLNCTDQLGRSSLSETRTFTIASTLPAWTGFWYERFNNNFVNTTAIINLSSTRDNAENNIAVNMTQETLYTMANAYSPYMAGHGVIIPNSTAVNFSGVFRVTDTDGIVKGYATWKAYLNNESGDFLIAQLGNDDNTNTGNNLLGTAAPAKPTLSGGVFTNKSWFLNPTDRLKLVVNMYSDERETVTFTHFWDYRSESWINFSNFIVIGDVATEIVEPATDIVVIPEDLYNQTCLVNCTYGTCINTVVYAQYNSTLPAETNWSNINSTGNLKLATGQNNPISLGNMTGEVYVNFSINASTASLNNIRCFATTNYNSAFSPTTRQVSVADFTPPNIILDAPGNNTHWNLANVTFYFNTTENVQLANCTLIINGQPNATKYTADLVKNGRNNISTLMGEGMFNWSVTCQDLSGNQGNSTARIVFIDRTPPEIVLNYPEEGHNFPSTTAVLNFTATDLISETLLCNLTVDNNVSISNFVVQSGVMNSTTVIGLTEGTHYWNVTCQDNATNHQTSETKSFNNYKPPAVNLIAPANNNISNNPDQTFYFNVSDDTGLTNCSLIINGDINSTKTGAELTNGAINNFTVNGMNGTFSWSVRCYDSSPLMLDNTTASWNLTVDLDAPSITIITESFTWFNTTTPIIRFNTTDNRALLINYTIFVNGTENSNSTANNGANTSATLSSIIPDGEYEIIIQVTDAAGNSANSTPIIIYVDTQKPWINLIAPPDLIELNSTSVEFNYTAMDNMAGYLMCNLTISNGMGENDTNATNNSTISISKGGFVSGAYYWNVTCSDIAGNTNTSITWTFTINAPDLIITSSNITFNESEPEEGKNMTIFANIYNIGGTPGYNLTVQFWNGDPLSGGLQIGTNQTIVSLASFENITLSITHQPLIGLNNIFVLVDPPTETNGSVIEENESNNKANRSFIVPLYQVFIGNVSGLIKMERQTRNDSIYLWNVSNYTGSNIYITDLEANPNFLALHAIGRNLSNETTINDFEEIDEKIGSTNLTDSVNSTYTQNSQPIATKTYSVFSSIINNVPIINSTNTSEFRTGILWDADDGGPEYNGSQDVIFVSEINQQAGGGLGIYDFEIKVPALLRNYNAAGSSLAFYAELK